MSKVLYRYEIEYKNEDGDTAVHLMEHKVLFETDKTYVIDINPWTNKRIRKTAFNTFAYDTKEKAKQHFIRRTNKRIAWFEFWKEECEKALKLIEKELDK